MAVAHLIHPIPIEYMKLDRQSTIQDHDFREPVQRVIRGPVVILRGQIKWYSDENTWPQRAGVDEETEGYVLFRLAELRKKSVSIHRGDRFIAFGSGSTRVEVDVYVVKVQYTAHYTTHKGPQLVKAFFQSRVPGRENRGVE